MSGLSYILVALGGASGALVRVLLSRFIPDAIYGVPLPILMINIIGCLLMGIIVELTALHWSIPQLRAFLVPGFLGGFTTFSSFALEFGLLYEKQAYWPACFYALFSFIGSICAFFIGLKIVRMHY